MHEYIKLRAVSPEFYDTRYYHAFHSNSLVNQCGSPFNTALHGKSDCFLSADNLSGFVVNSRGWLCHLFSLAKGRGEYLVKNAIIRGATNLNCFDNPHLISLYSRLGFVETEREENYNAGGPDVVYMEYKRQINPKGPVLSLLESILLALVIIVWSYNLSPLG
jgi:hypothetical protein